MLEISGQRGTGSGCLFFSFPLRGSTSEPASPNHSAFVTVARHNINACIHKATCTTVSGKHAKIMGKTPPTHKTSSLFYIVVIFLNM